MSATRKRKKVLKIIAVVLALIIVLEGIAILVGISGRKTNTEDISSYTHAVEPELIPEFDEETGVWTFTTDDVFTVMQLTDIHIGGGYSTISTDKKAMRAVAELIKRRQPDLVIITGDLIYPSVLQSGNLDNMAQMKMLAELMKATGVYWAPVFGNHESDPGSFYSRQKLGEFLETLNPDNGGKCLFDCGEVSGVGNYAINIENSDNEIIQSLYLFDSGDYVFPFIKYAGLQPDQIEWYKQSVAKTNAVNYKRTGTEKTVKSLAFFHIPLEEYADAKKEFEENGYEDTENVKLYLGDFTIKKGDGAFEHITPSYYPDEVFETFAALCSTQGVFVGHNHLNTWSLEYMSIRLTYGMSIDYLAYIGIGYLDAQRGSNVISINPDGSFNITQDVLKD